MNQSKTAKQLLEDFLAEARKQASDVEPIRVLRCNAFRVKDANVLVRVAADTGKFFFGLNYINAEEVANLDNAYIAFVCGAVDNTVILPMQLFVQQLPQISHDRNGEYKIVIKKNLDLALKGRNNTIPLKECLAEAYLDDKTTTYNPQGIIPNDPDIPKILDRVYPCHEVVKIDYFLPGCPPRADLIWDVLVALVTGAEVKWPYETFKFD